MTKPRMNHVLFARIAVALVTGASSAQLVESTGLHPETIRNLLAVLRREGATVYSDWLPDRRGARTVREHRLKLSKFDRDVPRPVSDATLDRRRYGRA